MKLRTFYALCCLCLLRSLAAEENRGQNPATLTIAQSLDSQKLNLYLDESNPRDKRALGLILSGLAQVFGYDVSPIQVASLPNPEPPTVIALSATNQTQQAANASGSSTTVSPRQRETIRFTGVLNFGNNGSLQNQLQEYEQIFHGAGNATSPTNATTPTTAAPTLDQRQPFLVNIPLPVMRQPPLPEIPPQDIMLSYPPIVPIRYVPVQTQPGTVNRKNESSTNQTVGSRPAQNGQEVKSPPTPVGFASTSEPPWKREYEERLAELERKQAEQAERLRQQERFRTRVKDDDYNNKDHKWSDGKGTEDSRCNDKEKDSYSDAYSSAEDDGSSEKYRDRSPDESQEDEDDGSRDYEDQKPLKQQEELPISDNYTNVPFETLPITGDHEHQWPEELRNSYGELLNSSELADGFANFFNQFRDSNLYPLPGGQDAKEALKEGDYSKEDEDESGERREEIDLPARNKYEEYSLEDDGDTKRKGDDKNLEEDAPDQPVKLPNKFLPAGGNRSRSGGKSNEEVDYSSFMPLIVPARYVSVPEDAKIAKSRVATIEKPNRVKVANKDSGKKIQGKDSRNPKKDLKPKPSILDRQLPKKLHEGEQKELQLWPAPFDFVLDGTIQTDDVSGKLGRRFVKAPVVARKIESGNGRMKEARKLERHATAESPGQRSRVPSENNSYELFKEGHKPRTVSSRPSEPIKRDNRKKSETPNMKQLLRGPPQSAETKDHWDRYKYSTNDDYGVTSRSIIEVLPHARQTSSSFSKRFEGLKRSIGKIEPVSESYFTERPPADNMKLSDARNPRGFQIAVPKYTPPTSYERSAPGYYHFPAMNYQVQKMENERAVSVIAPRQDGIRHDESFTKYASEPENRGEKVAAGSYSAGELDVGGLGQKDVELNRPISYFNYVHML
nr:uncharacterized protein LOC117217447 [Megalopta genalis]